MPIRLAIIDGHTLTRYGLRELIARHPDIEIVAECQSAADAPRMVAAERPEVVTLEIRLPDGDGLQLAREFRDRYADLGIVVLTAQHEDDVLFRALETGVSAFVAKTAPVEEMVAAIRHAAVAASSFTASGLATALARRRTVQERLALSPRETEVLRLLHDGLSVPAIALAMFISQSTAKTYVARLYDKLDAANRAQALMTAMHYGLITYRQDPPPTGAAASARPASADAPTQRNWSVSPLPGRTAHPPSEVVSGLARTFLARQSAGKSSGAVPARAARKAGRPLRLAGGTGAQTGCPVARTAGPNPSAPRGVRPAVSRLVPKAARPVPGVRRRPCAPASAMAA
jgi:DNA-binding NarL/FixJ family response regulator